MDSIVLKIKGLLKEKKHTYEEFSEAIGKSRPTINNYMKGASKIDVYTMKDIANFLGVQVAYFYNEDISTHEKPKKYIEQRIEDLEKRMNKLENKL